MDIHQTRVRLTAFRNRLPVSWVTITLLAVVIAYANGFWVTSLQGTVGAIERNQPPFDRWIHDSTLMLPLFFLGVLAALLLTRRWVGQSKRELVQLAVAAALIIGISTGISVAEVTASSAYDYHLQSSRLELQYASHVHDAATPAGTVTPGGAGTCVGLCAARRGTFLVHEHAVGYASVMMLITNLVLVVWGLALRGGRLWTRRVATAAPTLEPTTEALTGGVLV